MSHIRIDKQKAMKKWSPVLENMGVAGEDRLDWMSEYAEFHSINENAYANASNVSGMGAVIAAQPNSLAGNTIGNYANAVGSGDVGQNLLPVAMKIAAQTIGLDLVAVKPSPGPKIDLLYIDFRYDDNHLGADDERPQVFKLNIDDATERANVKADLTSVAGTQTQGGLTGRWFTNINTNNGTVDPASATEPVGSKAGIVEFLGFSRIDGYPMFRAYRQFNTSHTAVTSANATWGFDATRNTFAATSSMVDQIDTIGSIAVTSGSDGLTVELVSALEDHKLVLKQLP
jgi:hypothetical protein